MALPALVTSTVLIDNVSGVIQAEEQSLVQASVANAGTIVAAGSFSIVGDLVNTGTVKFTGPGFHALTVTGSYIQGDDGVLEIRLGNGIWGIGFSDKLSIGGSATLAGTLKLTAEEALAAGQVWTVIVATEIIGNFTTRIFPNDGNPNWRSLIIPPYLVLN